MSRISRDAYNHVRENSMGWWDSGIMGGDTPLDYQDAIHDILGIGYDENPASAQLPDSKLRDIISHAESNGWLEFEPWIFWEVLAAIIMGAGAAMPEDIRANAVSAVDNEIASDAIDNWKKPAERRARLGELRQAVEAYNGMPVTLNETGPEKMDEFAPIELVARRFAQMFHTSYMQASAPVRSVIEEMSALVMAPGLDTQERDMALATLADALGLLGVRKAR